LVAWRILEQTADGLQFQPDEPPGMARPNPSRSAPVTFSGPRQWHDYLGEATLADIASCTTRTGSC
jgi:hypothetical protein